MEAKDKIILNGKATKIGGSVWILIPTSLKEWINLQEGQQVKIQTEQGQHGKYLAIWNPEQ